MFLYFVHRIALSLWQLNWHRTQRGNQGTSSFQSPEQLTAMDVGVGADSYAVGGVLVELFGEKPV